MQVVGGRFSDRRGRRKLILAGSGFLIACWLTSASAFFIGSRGLVYLAYLLWGLSLLSLPVIDATMADYIETPDRSRVYSTMLVANFIPGSITGFLAGQYGASLNPPLLLVLAAGLETVGFAYGHRVIPDVSTSPVFLVPAVNRIIVGLLYFACDWVIAVSNLSSVDFANWCDFSGCAGEK